MRRQSSATRWASTLTVVLAACTAAHTPLDADTIRCTSSGECYGPVPYCDPVLGACVPCVRDEDCGLDDEGMPRYQCDPASGECEQCLVDAWCLPGPEGPGVCGPTSHRCFQGCEGDWDCDSGIEPFACHESERVCVRCVAGPRCDPELHFTAECLTAEHCPPEAPLCTVHSCTVSCDVDGRCPAGRYCEPRSMVCVECTMNAHCPDDAICRSDFACILSP